MSENLIQVRDLVKHFPIKQGFLQRIVGAVRAVDGVTFDIKRGGVLGVVGESGCGKSTMARLLINLIPATSGSVIFDGQDMFTKNRSAQKRLRRRTSLVFQDPFNSLNPRMTVAQLVGEPLTSHGIIRNKAEREDKVVELMEDCGLFADQIYRYPHQFSGGQRQRICIARALASEPDFIVCDEAVSALDVSIQAQIINLLCDLKEQRDLTYLFISHDLNVVRFISDEVAVMYLGQIVEKASKDELFDHPAHPYTIALLSAVPQFDVDADEVAERPILGGDIPSPSDPPSGCRFHTRCPYVMEVCSEVQPEMREISPGHTTMCHRCL
jgi:oligopeptide/dipeptide ABC transporter ATP-binding protein